MESVESEFDELFDIDTWRKGGFVNHYKALYEERNMVGYDEGAFDNYIFEQENTIKVNKKSITIYGLIQLVQYRLHLLDGFIYYISYFDDDNMYGLSELESQRGYRWDFLQRNIDIIKILLPIYKPLLFSNYYITTYLKKEGYKEYISDIEYGKELLEMCDAIDPIDLKQYHTMIFAAEPRPKSGYITEMEGLICSMSESNRSEIGLESYPVKWVKSLFDLRKRQSILRKFKLLDPFFVNCLQDEVLKFKGDDLVINDEVVEHVTSFHPRDEEFNEIHTRRANTLLRVFGRKKLPDSWPFFEPMNLGIVKLHKNNLYIKWIIHLQNNLQDWNNKFEKA